jgi:sulfhydrogenase subunit alpha
VEIVHCTEDAISIIDQLLELGVRPEPLAPVGRMPGEGVGVCEVPRGLLIHNYEIGGDGKVTGANCIIPTNQNLGNLQADFRVRVPQILDKSLDSMRLDLEMLVRAYDPCISCSVHVLEVKFE